MVIVGEAVLLDSINMHAASCIVKGGVVISAFEAADHKS
jgi:hypothetical protein